MITPSIRCLKKDIMEALTYGLYHAAFSDCRTLAAADKAVSLYTADANDLREYLQPVDGAARTTLVGMCIDGGGVIGRCVGPLAAEKHGGDWGDM